MKQTIFALMLGLLCVGTASADHVDVNIHIGHPNFFGEIDLGDLPPPPVIQENPIIIRRPYHHRWQPPIYLRVPPHHQRNWRVHCVRYGACNRPVYFVRDDWYTNEYVPRYHERHHDDDDHDHGDYHDHHNHGHDHHDHDRDRDYDRH